MSWEIKEREGFELFSSMDTHALSQSFAESVKQCGRFTYWILKDEDVKAVTKIATDISAVVGDGWGFGFDRVAYELLVQADMQQEGSDYRWINNAVGMNIITESEFEEIGLPAEQIDDQIIWQYQRLKREGAKVNFSTHGKLLRIEQAMLDVFYTDEEPPWCPHDTEPRWDRLGMHDDGMVKIYW